MCYRRQADIQRQVTFTDDTEMPQPHTNTVFTAIDAFNMPQPHTKTVITAVGVNINNEIEDVEDHKTKNNNNSYQNHDKNFSEI